MRFCTGPSFLVLEMLGRYQVLPVQEMEKPSHKNWFSRRQGLIILRVVINVQRTNVDVMVRLSNQLTV